MKILPLEADPTHAVRRTDTNLIVAFRNIANTPKLYEVAESEAL